MKKNAGHWVITEVGCPECAGVLSVMDDGEHRHREYRCHVGHRFSLRSLLQLKETQLERLLWSALAVMDHVACVCETAKSPAGLRRGTSHAALRRIRQLRRQRRVVRSLIEETCLCDLGEP